MDPRRWHELMESRDKPLCIDELEQGWHWCREFDGLLVGPGMEGELSCCTCELGPWTAKLKELQDKAREYEDNNLDPWKDLQW